MHLLLGDCVDVTEVAKAQELLTTFHRLIPELYPIEMCTANMNSLLLLSQFVEGCPETPGHVHVLLSFLPKGYTTLLTVQVSPPS